MGRTEFESAAKDMVCVSRRTEKKRRSADDIIYMLMGEATAGNILVMVFAMALFGGTPVAMLIIFGAYSGGMGWLIALGLVTVMAVVALYLMKRGVEGSAKEKTAKPAVTAYPGEMTRLTETFGRAKGGYVYSQQVIRERLCEIAIDRISLARDLDREQVTAMLEKGDTACVGDDFLSKFLLANRSGAQTWEESRSQTKGKSKERGERFMIEIDEIIKHVEAMT